MALLPPDGRGVGPTAVVLADPGRPATPSSGATALDQVAEANDDGARDAGPGRHPADRRAVRPRGHRSTRCASSRPTPSSPTCRSPSGSTELRRPEVRERILGRRARPRLRRRSSQRRHGPHVRAVATRPTTSRRPTQAIAAPGRAPRRADVGARLRPAARRRRPRHALPPVPELLDGRPRAGAARCCSTRNTIPGPERRRRPRRHDLRRQLPHLPAHPLGARPRRGARASAWPRPCTARPRPPPTAVGPRRPGRAWRRATGPTSTSSTSTALHDLAAPDHPRPAHRREAAGAAGRRATATPSWPAPRSMTDGTWTGATPGRLVRGPQPAPDRPRP